MKLIAFEVLMKPTAKARARTVVHNGITRSYTPSKTVDSENMIRVTYYDHYLLTDRFSKPTAIKLTCVFVLSKPKSAPKKREILPTTRPDIDNYIKLVLDSLNGYAFDDDSQIIELHASKVYGDIPKIRIQMEGV